MRRSRSAELRALVGERDVRRLLAVRMAGQAGDGLFQAALFGAVFFDPGRATSAAQAAAAFAALLLPYSVVGPFAGVLLDRWRRQRVLRDGNALRVVLVAGFAALLAALGPSSAPVVLLALLVVSVNRFILSGLSAALPHVVAPRSLVTAGSATTTLGAGAAAAGGGLAVVLRPVLGADDGGAALTSLLAAAAYGLAALLAGRVSGRRYGPVELTGTRLREDLAAVARGVAAGAHHVWSRGPALRALAAITAHRFWYGLSAVGTLLLYTPHGAVGRGVAGLGQVVAATVLGGLVAALVTPAVTHHIGTQRWIAVLLAAACVAEAGSWRYAHRDLLVAAFVLGIAAQGSKICVDALVQESVADAFRGRVFSFYDTLFNVSFVAAAAAAAVLLPSTGKSHAALALIAVGYAATAVVYGAATARRSASEPPEPVLLTLTAP